MSGGANVPVEPVRRSRIVEWVPFPYSWVVLAVALVTTAMTLPGQTAGVSVFLDAIVADLGASRSTVSLLYMLGTLTGSAALPFVGRFIDARGPRVAVTAIALGFALACAFMSQVGGLAMLAVAFVAIRGLGQGSLSLVSVHEVNLWFVKRRGLAVGIAGLGMSVATAFVPPLLEQLQQAVGWRTAYLTLAAVVATVALPLGVTFFRDRPERYGRLPDGGWTSPATPPAPTKVEEPSWTAREARGTAAFWSVCLASMSVAAWTTGLIFHHYDLLAARGLDRAAASVTFVPLGLVAAAANLAVGALLDRVAPRFVIATMMVGQAAAALLCVAVTADSTWLYGAVLGATMGANGAVSGTVYAQYFGRRHLGAIKGFASTMTVAGSALGPLVLAVGNDLFAGYAVILAIVAIVPLAQAVVAVLVRPPSPSVGRPTDRPA